MTITELRARIATKELRVDQVAKICGVSQRVVYYWLEGKRVFLERHARLLSITLELQRISQYEKV